MSKHTIGLHRNHRTVGKNLTKLWKGGGQRKSHKSAVLYVQS